MRKEDEEARPKVQISAEEAAKIIQSHWRKGSTLRARAWLLFAFQKDPFEGSFSGV